MNELALFAGAGGGILGGHLLGWRTVCAVEWEPYAACVLAARQNDGILPPFPIWDDVQTFDGRPWRGIVDVVSGGFPCQDISAAGRGAGIDGERSGMWSHMARIIGEVRPRYVYVENSPMLTSRGCYRVLGDLAEMGFDARWGVVSAAAVGAPHKRDRIWIVANSISSRAGSFCREIGADRGRNTGGHEPALRQAYGTNGADWVGTASKTQSDDLAYAKCLGWEKRTAKRRTYCDKERADNFGDCNSQMADANGTQCKGIQFTERATTQHSDVSGAGWWSTEPDVGRVAHGVAARVDRLKAIGNGQVPLVAATAWRILNDPA